MFGLEKLFGGKSKDQQSNGTDVPINPNAPTQPRVGIPYTPGDPGDAMSIGLNSQVNAASIQETQANLGLGQSTQPEITNSPTPIPIQGTPTTIQEMPQAPAPEQKAA